MIISHHFKQCTICLSKEDLTREHVIPQSIGGLIEIKSQCTICNSERFGSELLPALKQYYPVRCAIRALRKDLPELFNRIEHGLLYLAKDTIGKISTLAYRYGKPKTLEKKEEDGSLVFRSENAEGHINRLLKKSNLSEEVIRIALKEYSEAEYDSEVLMPDGSTVVKRRYTEYWQKPGPTTLDPRIPALLAYNYLCVVLEQDVFLSNLDGMRNFILNGTDTAQLTAEEFPYTAEYAPYHHIWLETNEDSTIVHVLLFGSIGLRITIMELIITGGNYNIVMDLKKNRVLSAKSFEEARQGMIFSN